MQARAIRKYIRSSPRKMRPVVNLVRDKNVPEAIATLNFMPHKPCSVVEKTVMNAVHNLNDQNPDEYFDEDELEIQEIRVDEGQTYKRWQAGARGRAKPIEKRTSHLTVVVAVREEAEEFFEV
jgi:large subunit ribosomal protein L22